jgi:hypothetical protein
MRGKGPWLSIKSIFAPTEVAASLALIVLVVLFTLVYFGTRHRPAAASPSVAVSQASPVPDVSPSPSSDRSPVAQPAADSGLGTVIRAALATTRRRGSGAPTPAVSASPTDAGSPTLFPTPTDTPTPSPTDTPTPTPTASPSPTDIPTPLPTPAPTVSLSPLPSPS